MLRPAGTTGIVQISAILFANLIPVLLPKQNKKPFWTSLPKKSTKTRKVSTDLVSSSFDSVMRDIEILRKHSSNLSRMISAKKGKEVLTLLELANTEFSCHPVVLEDFSKSKYLEKILRKVTEEKPKNYEEFLATEGVGPKTVRALSLVSEI